MGFFKSKLSQNNEKKKENKPLTQTVNQTVVGNTQTVNQVEKKLTDTVIGNNQTVEQETEKDYAIYASGEFDKNLFIPKIRYKRLVEKKLIVVLIENTTEVAKAKDTLNKIIKSKIIESLVSSGVVCIINYGTTVRQREIWEVPTLEDIAFLCDDDIGNNACLYDALVEAESLISKQYINVLEKEQERVKISDFEVIGIGTCKDTCSKASKEFATEKFCEMVRQPKVVTKYFCLTEENFNSAAEIGFRSIGAIFKKY